MALITWLVGNGPAATHQTRVAIDRGDANQGSNLMAGDSPEFGQFSEKSPCGHIADARNGFQERLGFAPSWGMLDGVAMSWSIASSSFWR